MTRGTRSRRSRLWSDSQRINFIVDANGNYGYDGTAVNFNIACIPEPATAAGVLTWALPVVLRRRRRA